MYHREMKLRFGWWNTGLTGRREPDEGPITVAAGVVRALIDDLGCSVIGLCETAPGALHVLMKRLRLGDEWEVLRAPAGSGASHDLVVVFDTLVVRKVRHESVNAKVAGHVACAALVLEIELPLADSLRLGLSHWPAIGMGDQDHVRGLQREMATSLRGAINVEPGRPFDRVLLVGDFNVEPFQSPMLMLGGTRDMEQVRRRSGLLYNAAWRWLGAAEPFGGRVGVGTSFGTHFYRSGVESRWRTYDQVLVSASLVSGVGWTLREDETFPWHGEAVRGPKGAYIHEHLDHLPLIATLEYIERRPEDERDDDE